MGTFGKKALVVLATAWLTLMAPRLALAQWEDLTGQGVIVFDPTAVMKLVYEIELMVRNLQTTGWAGEDVERLMRTLDEVSAIEHALHYQLPNLDPLMQERHPGYQYDTSTAWWPNVEQWSSTGLNTMRGSLDTVHEQLRIEQRAHEEQVLAALAAKTEAAVGNLDVTQAGNLINLQTVQEVRKLRQMMGALINAQTVAQAQQIHLHMVGERVQHDLMENSVAPIPTVAEGDAIHPVD